MRRADRLFRIVQLLRGRRFMTAAKLAERLEVSERTIYRDVADLVASGARIVGEAGVGYRVDARFELPPLMFDLEEIRALVLGARMVESWSDDALRGAARSALDKIEGVLPPERRGLVEETALYSLSFHVPAHVRAHVGVVRTAIDSHRRVAFDYETESGNRTHRTVRPLGLYFWGGTWTVGAFCELREDYRSFRLDRMEDVAAGDPFPIEPPATRDAFLEAMRERDRLKASASP